MENSPLFDLNEAIRCWRERVIGQRSFGADDLEELENHLRESVSELQAGSLSLEEAFLVATERLGSERRLAEEYAKTNVRRIWTGRAAWMLGGVVASLSMEALVMAGASISFNLSEWMGLHGRLIVTVGFLTRWAICVAGIGLGGWLVARRNRWLTGTVTKCFQRPVWTGAVLLLGLLGLQLLSVQPALWWHHHHPAVAPSPAGSAHLRAWVVSAMVLNRMACIAAIPLLAAYLWKVTRTGAASLPALPFDHLQPDERALAGRLEAQGFSHSESHLVIAWRRGYRPASVQAKTRFISGLWLERGFWMIVGVVAGWMLRDFVEMPSWILVHSDISSPPLWQHFGGLVSTCLPLTLVGAAIAAFWKGATGAQKRNGRRRRVFEESPVRGAMLFAALAVLWVGLTAYLTLVRPAGAPYFEPSSDGRIGMIWWVCRLFLIHFFLPVILLVWVGNRYQTGRKLA
jgi:hypothetical protein